MLIIQHSSFDMISLESKDRIRNIIDKSTSGTQPSLPGLVYCAVNANGDEFFKYASGHRGSGVEEPMTLDSVFWLASFTKVLTGIACMQLVEQSKIGLDSTDDVEKYAPELRQVQVLAQGHDGSLHLTPKDRGITLRMLLNHTG